MQIALGAPATVQKLAAKTLPLKYFHRGAQAGFQCAEDGSGLGVGDRCFARKKQRVGYRRSEKFWQVQAVDRNVTVSAANFDVVRPVVVMNDQKTLAEEVDGRAIKDDFGKNVQADVAELVRRKIQKGVGIGSAGPTCQNRPARIAPPRGDWRVRDVNESKIIPGRFLKLKNELHHIAKFKSVGGFDFVRQSGFKCDIAGFQNAHRQGDDRGGGAKYFIAVALSGQDFDVPLFPSDVPGFCLWNRSPATGLNFPDKIFHERGIAIGNTQLFLQAHLLGEIFRAAASVGADAICVRCIETGHKVFHQTSRWFINGLAGKESVHGAIWFMRVHAVQNSGDNVPNFDFVKLAVFKNPVGIGNRLGRKICALNGLKERFAATVNKFSSQFNRNAMVLNGMNAPAEPVFGFQQDYGEIISCEFERRGQAGNPSADDDNRPIIHPSLFEWEKRAGSLDLVADIALVSPGEMAIFAIAFVTDEPENNSQVQCHGG